MRTLNRSLNFASCGLLFIATVVMSLAQDPAPAPAPAPVTTDATVTTDENAATAGRMAQEEDRRRNETVMLANQALEAAEIMLKAGDLDKAEERYNYVLKNVEPGGASLKLYQKAQRGLAQTFIARSVLAQQEGNYTLALEHLNKADRLMPEDERIAKMRNDLKKDRERADAQRRNPESTTGNPAVTPEFIEKVASVQRLLFEGDRYFETGQYDKADKRYRDALVLDQYNKTARQKLERLDRYKMRSAKTAHETSRTQALYDVQRRWHEAERPDDLRTSGKVESNTSESNIARIISKLTSIKIPEITFNDTPVEDAIRFLQAKSRELDPDKVGVNFVAKLQATSQPVPANLTGAAAKAAAAAPPAPVAPRSITLSLSNVTLDEALRLLTNLTNLKYKVEEYAVFILPVTESSEVLVTRTFSVPPGFFQGGLSTPQAAGGAGLRGAGAGTTTVDTLKVDVKQQLGDQGVDFPAGATAAFLAGSSKLVVKNTPEQMDVIDSLIQSRQVEEPQVEIETKYVEFTEDALKEMSFNWALNYNKDLSTLPLIETSTGSLTAPTNTGFIPDILPLPLQSLKQFGSAAGASALRTQNALPSNSLDAILRARSVDQSTIGTTSTANQLFLGAVLGDRAFGVLANLIDQVGGIDLLSAPKVTTKSRNAAKVEIIREMRYPTSFEPPKFNGSPIVFDGQSAVLIVPPTPSDFQTQSIGVILDVTPTAYPDRRIDLELKPTVTDFEGFVNYGSSVNVGSVDTDVVSVLTSYKIQQPVFNIRSITTKVQVIDGQTVVMGGLVREDRQELKDKVPLLGDIPFAGKLFQSSITKTIKRNLVIFVTARLIRPTGKPRFIQDLDDATEPVVTASAKP